VYLQAIAAELAAGRGAIVMVPEISLTPQTVQRFASRFGDMIAVLHSALSDGERYDEWHRIRSGKARVVVGPRSAVFAPVRNLGLIVVDEEHDTSYKQDDTPRYNARDVAVLRGRIEGAKVVLGSATPSLESWMNARRGKYTLATMKNRAGAGTLPETTVVDMSSGPEAGRIFSKDLLDAVSIRLDRGEQTILFLNRRGYSRSVTCTSCSAPVVCPKCSVPYTYHMADSCCRCHVCGGWIPVPGTCPSCGSPRLEFKGVGTQRVESALKQCFPRARVLRMDADSTSRRHSHDDILGAFRRHEADILVGTQMITKGLDFPNVTLVGVLNAENSLNMPDFRAAERTFQLISQVAGRAGRSELPGEAIIQCRDPNAVAVRAAADGDFAAFAENELREREAGFFPPFCHLAAVSVRSKSPQLASGWADLYAKSLVAADMGLDVGEAVPGALEKADGWHRWQIVVRSRKVGAIVGAWKWVCSRRPPPKTVRISIDVDAHNLM
jgi:primosomal protein N' (replication factor Y)